MKIKGSDFFIDGMAIFLDYIARKLKENPNYEPHPLIRAFECALAGIEKKKIGENVMGVSGDESKFGGYFNPYAVILKKERKGIIVEKIIDLTSNKDVPLDFMITIFRLQIHLDRFPGEEIRTEDAVKVLNKVLPGMHFYALGEKWIEARDRFRDLLKEGKIKIPMDGQLKEELLKIKYNTPWEEYPPQVRSLIGGIMAREFDSRPGTIVLTTPPKMPCSKYKIFSFVSEVLLGEGSRYILNRQDCLFCRMANVEEYMLSSWNNFIILADKYPLVEGHILVITKEHVRAVGDLLPEKLQELPEIINTIRNFYCTHNYDEFVMFEPGLNGQSVFHSHIHFLPGSYSISKALQIMGFTIVALAKVEELIDFYKKHGNYLFWLENNQMFVCVDEEIKTKINPSFFRHLIAGQLMKSDKIDWKKYESDKVQFQEARQNVEKLIDSWRGI